MSQKKLYIPVRIRKRKEIVDGFGKEEIIKTIIAFAIGVGIGIFSCLIKGFHVEFIIFIPAIITFACILFVRKNSVNLSTVDVIKQMFTYNKSQKKFYYKYHNIYEKELEKEKKVEENTNN